MNDKRNDKIMPAHKVKRRLLTNEERRRENEEEGQELENENLVHLTIYHYYYHASVNESCSLQNTDVRSTHQKSKASKAKNENEQ